MNGEIFNTYTLMPKNMYNEWQEFIKKNIHLSELDKKIKNILNENNISQDKKWALYKKELIKYAKLREPIQSEGTKTSNTKIKHDASTQAFTPLKKDVSTNPILISEEEHPLKNGEKTYIEDIYESPPLEESITQQNIEIKNDSLSDVDPEDLEIALFDEAQNILGASRHSDIIKDKTTLHKSYRTFMDRSTNNKVDIFVADVEKQLKEKNKKSEKDSKNSNKKKRVYKSKTSPIKTQSETKSHHNLRSTRSRSKIPSTSISKKNSKQLGGKVRKSVKFWQPY